MEDAQKTDEEYKQHVLADLDEFGSTLKIGRDMNQRS